MSSALNSSSTSSDQNSNSAFNNTESNTINVDPSEVEKFNNLASEWWSNTGPLQRYTRSIHYV